MKQHHVHHERSLPNRPQTNVRAERFHQTLAEGMRSLLPMSVLPYVFRAFCLAACVVNTRDVRFLLQLCCPFLELCEWDPDSMCWVARMFQFVPADLTATADVDGRCTLCGMWAPSCEPTCWACVSGRRRAKHDHSHGCLHA